MWQRYHLQMIFAQWKSTTLRWIYFPRPNQIKVSYWKLTIYDGNMFQSNESSGIIITRVKRIIWAKTGVLEHSTLVFSLNWSDDPWMKPPLSSLCWNLLPSCVVRFQTLTLISIGLKTTLGGLIFRVQHYFENYIFVIYLTKFVFKILFIY